MLTTLKINSKQIIDGDISWDRIVDTESKILHEISKRLNGENVSGSIKLFTELAPCESCNGVIYQFLEKYPNITIEIIHSEGVQLLP